jgi:hypothetical protein
MTSSVWTYKEGHPADRESPDDQPEKNCRLSLSYFDGPPTLLDVRLVLLPDARPSHRRELPSGLNGLLKTIICAGQQ